MPTRVKVTPSTTTPTHSLSISDGSQSWGLILVDGPRSIQENSISPSTLLINSQGKRYGDFDPSMSHIEQMDWSGGRANENFTTDEARYFDSQNLWTTTPETTMPSLQWKYATGYRGQDAHQLSTVYNWRPLIGKHYSMLFVASTSYSADKAYVWIRRVGTPGDITVSIHDEGGGSTPGAVLKTISISAANVPDVLAGLQVFDWAGTVALTATTNYHISVHGADTDNAAAHWEVMCGTDLLASWGNTSADGTTWTNSPDQLYFRVVDTDTDRTWKFFLKAGVLYAVDIKASGASQLYSESGGVFTEVATTGLGTVTDAAVNNGVVYFAQGESTNIRKWSGAAFSDEGTSKATFLWSFYDGTAGSVLWRANTVAGTAANISRAPSGTYAGTLTFATAINVGDFTYPITGLVDYNNYLWVMKQDSLWQIVADKPTKLSVGLDDAPSPANGAASVAHGLFLIFSFLGSVERLYSTTLDDIGPGRGAGLPSGRQGYVSSMESVISTLFVAIDAGDAGTSSVLAFDGINYHEVWRAPKAGKRIRNIKWQPGTLTTRPRLWIECGGDIIYVTYPLNTFNPLRDSGIYFAPEGVLTSATFDMGASRLPKLYKDLTVISKNLDGVCKIALDYQMDDDIGTDTWITMGDFLLSPSDTQAIDEGKRYAMRFRYRLQTNDALLPPIIKATVLEGVARTPVKYQWVLRVKTSSIQSTFTGSPDHKPDALLTWLKEKAGNAEVLHMHSSIKAMDGKIVMAEPPTVMRDFSNSILKFWGGQVVIVLREA
jgi:hypothetical protein